jgi:hypothetical protein
MIDPEVLPIGTRAGTRWIVVLDGRAMMYPDETAARDAAQVLIARGGWPITRCAACGNRLP